MTTGSSNESKQLVPINSPKMFQISSFMICWVFLLTVARTSQAVSPRTPHVLSLSACLINVNHTLKHQLHVQIYQYTVYISGCDIRLTHFNVARPSAVTQTWHHTLLLYRLSLHKLSTVTLYECQCSFHSLPDYYFKKNHKWIFQTLEHMWPWTKNQS